ncbi:membrane-associated protein [Frondihabitans sp. PhB188]|uniref:DedA family protein n=1 Tax=Frondihabitans sp. PhB188 TaxID=2485200 RepID=UPI000F48BFF7|nr:VTT domain-containing protein [Frondihabitans sp. PhB188]ROQ41377.1 membrane-associated protein [Frondihabitans sp. PhB188]
MLLDPQALLENLGPWGLVGLSIIIFIESGVLFPFLPGDSLLVTAGLLHDKLGLAVATIAICAFVAAFLGDQVGYFLGNRFGRRLFKPDARILKTEYLERAEAFFARYGGPALILGRFVPIVRTYVPLAAGASGYTYRKFLLWNVTGAALWAGGLTVIGSLLSGFPFITEHIDVLAIVIVLISVGPIVVHGLLERRKAKRAAAADAAAATAAAPTGK